mgnify:CR=1 FL=1
MGKKVPAIPTMYRNVRYRSRLEARWAAMFDKLGWKYEYEPIDLNGWIPDFCLQAMDGKPVLVEVKPVRSFPSDVADKIARGICGTDLAGAYVAILGYDIECEPLPDDDFPLHGEIRPGWSACSTNVSMAEFDGRDTSGIMLLNGEWGSFAITQYCDGVLNVFESRKRKLLGRDWPVDVRDLWAEAGNEVQWNGRVSK